jgi:hypothetical protein
MWTAKIYLMMLDLTLTLSLPAVEAVRHLQQKGRDALAMWRVAQVSRERLDSVRADKEQETIRKSFTLDAAASRRVVEIDNVFGSIEVVSSSSNQAQVVIAKTITAESKERLEAARKEVALDVTQTGNEVKLYVNGPFRHRCCCDCGGFREGDGYLVKWDFQLQVPPNTELKLKTVTDGHIRMDGVTGNYTVRNVNGPVEMVDVAGSGLARTVNGEVKVTFRDNPHADSEFASINGAVELQFVKNLAADFRFRTLNGEIYSDFPLTALPARPPVQERKSGKLVFRADRYTGVRVGAGGPEIKVENLNGDIRVLERKG